MGAVPKTTSIGLAGGSWRQQVTPWGAVLDEGGGLQLDWWVAAEDRWHTPERETATRQRLLDGVPVVETAVRVPGGDAVQTVYAAADGGSGLTVVALENRSPAALAVALSRRDLLTSRPPAEVPVQGGDAPPDALVLPIAHRSTVVVALAHDGRGPGPLPAGLPPPAAVARGWRQQTEVGSDLRLPAPAADPATLRAQLLLDGPARGRAGQVFDGPAFLVGVAELGRLGREVDPWVADVVVAAEDIARVARRSGALDWTLDAGLAAAQEVLTGDGHRRGATDLAALRRRLPAAGATPEAPPEGILALAWAQRRVVTEQPGRPDALDLLPAPFPERWLGQPLEVHRLPVAGRVLGLAVRWHGRRPALLWEVDGPPVTLRSSGLDLSWSSAAVRGEALLAAPR